MIVDEAHTCVADGTGGRTAQLRYELLHALAGDDRAAPDPGHRHPAFRARTRRFRSLLGLLDPALATVDLASRSTGRRRRLARHFVQRRRADIRDYLDEDTAFPERPAAEDGPTRSRPTTRRCSTTCSPTPASRSPTPTGGRRRSGSRWWSALGLLRSLASSPRAAAQTLRTRAERPRRGRPSRRPTRSAGRCCDMADDETPSGIDARPARTPTTATTATRRTGAGCAASRAAERAARWRAPARPQAAPADQAGEGAAGRRLRPDRVLPVHPHRRLRGRAPAQQRSAARYAVAAVTGTLPPASARHADRAS